jgi:hypothetical protein
MRPLGGAYLEPEGARPKSTPESKTRIERYRIRRQELETEMREKHRGLPDGHIRAFVTAQLKIEGLTR